MALKGKVIDKMAALMTAAFGLVAALAWNGAILAIFNTRYLAPQKSSRVCLYTP